MLLKYIIDCSNVDDVVKLTGQKSQHPLTYAAKQLIAREVCVSVIVIITSISRA